MEKDTSYITYCAAAEDALANYLGTDDLDQDIIELVADCCRSAVSVLPNWTYFTNLLEKASTYVEVDMDEDTMQDFTGELEAQLENWGLL
jgi:hypothetical protein